MKPTLPRPGQPPGWQVEDQGPKHLDQGLTAESRAYHAHPGLGQSTLKAFLQDPVCWSAQHIYGDITRSETSRSQQWGLDFENLVFFDSLGDVVEIPPEVLNSEGHRKGKTWVEFARSHPGKRLMKPAEFREEFSGHLRGRENLRAHPKARALIWGSKSIQQGIVWPDESGLTLKAQIDSVHPSLLCDLKTSRDTRSEQFTKDIAEYGYHWQAHYYRQGWQAVTGELLPFVFVVVRNTAPWDVAIYELDDVWYSRAASEIRRSLDCYRGYCERQDWPSAHQATPLRLPAPRSQWLAEKWDRLLADLTPPNAAG